jgi:hypothetical protein
MGIFVGGVGGQNLSASQVCEIFQEISQKGVEKSILFEMARYARRTAQQSQQY